MNPHNKLLFFLFLPLYHLMSKHQILNFCSAVANQKGKGTCCFFCFCFATKIRRSLGSGIQFLVTSHSNEKNIYILWRESKTWVTVNFSVYQVGNGHIRSRDVFYIVCLQACLFASAQWIFLNLMNNLRGRRAQELGGGGTWAQCVELELRWRFCVHSSTCPEIYL